MRKLVANIREGDRVVGWAIACKSCALLFIGREDALYCSGACQMVGYRNRAREERPKEASGNSFMGSLVGFNE